ncbi:uncharacterized protein [Lolium perenne]|uniref:uncharacterized protein isoform X1 n=1 Tax=Lolium perenne TaxID=4522 RepID=UPI0021F6596A|nr:uncharacterized protein LOC127314498 isoform X1 [Lolium perenne]
MVDLAAPMNIKRKDVEVVGGHGFSIFLDPKRIKLHLQDRKTLDMMEEDEPLVHAPTSTATEPTIVHDKVNFVSVGISSEPPSKVSEDQSAAAQAPMDMEMEADWQQHQLCQNVSFFSGFF